jgi:hypothetical protein
VVFLLKGAQRRKNAVVKRPGAIATIPLRIRFGKTKLMILHAGKIK